MTPREAMNQALADAVRTYLRPRGWTGSMPHFRLRTEHQICLLSFQFYSAGGSFVAEIAACGPDGYTSSWGRHWPPNKVTSHCINHPRPRLGNPKFPLGDHWFSFGPRNYHPTPDFNLPPEHYARVAADVMHYVDEQAVPWWHDRLS